MFKYISEKCPCLCKFLPIWKIGKLESRKKFLCCNSRQNKRLWGLNENWNELVGMLASLSHYGLNWSYVTISRVFTWLRTSSLLTKFNENENACMPAHVCYICSLMSTFFWYLGLPEFQVFCFWVSTIDNNFFLTERKLTEMQLRESHTQFTHECNWQSILKEGSILSPPPLARTKKERGNTTLTIQKIIRTSFSPNIISLPKYHKSFI